MINKIIIFNIWLFFKFINIHPNADGPDYTFNVSIDGGSNYNVSKTSPFATRTSP